MASNDSPGRVTARRPVQHEGTSGLQTHRLRPRRISAQRPALFRIEELDEMDGRHIERGLDAAGVPAARSATTETQRNPIVRCQSHEVHGHGGVSRIEWTDAPPAAAASSHPQGRQDRAEYPPAGRASLRTVPRGCRCNDLDPGCRERTGAAAAATACRPTELCAARPEPAPAPDRLRPRQERRIRRR